ncbi:MAG: hypothetical protein EOO29_36345 [Comamonadaceae bacterium]|nr:MAG: hypothetical protein EOO29_36345 [Comamonadaceae bacterium]
MKPQRQATVPALVAAINDRRMVSFVYHGTSRIVQPQCYGIGRRGAELLRGYEPARAGPAQERLYSVAGMSGLAVLGQQFSKPGPHYTRDDSAMAVIFAQL